MYLYIFESILAQLVVSVWMLSIVTLYFNPMYTIQRVCIHLCTHVSSMQPSDLAEAPPDSAEPLVKSVTRLYQLGHDGEEVGVYH